MRVSPATVLVADHNELDRRRLCFSLEQEEFFVREVADGDCLLTGLRKEIPHLIVLDWQLPPIRGMELCRRIKRHGDVPIMVLTTLEDEGIKLKALDLYAEDYLQKPVSEAEVVARIGRVLRRTWLCCEPSSSTAEVDELLSIDFLRRETRTPQGAFHLTPIESRLLQLLVRNTGQVLPTELLLERLWSDTCGSTSYLWEYMRRLRHKIGDSAANPRCILNEPGLGYRFALLVHHSHGREHRQLSPRTLTHGGANRLSVG